MHVLWACGREIDDRSRADASKCLGAGTLLVQESHVSFEIPDTSNISAKQLHNFSITASRDRHSSCGLHTHLCFLLQLFKADKSYVRHDLSFSNSNVSVRSGLSSVLIPCQPQQSRMLHLRCTLDVERDTRD